MSSIENKRTLAAACGQLAGELAQPFREMLADDCVWHMIGTTPWSGSTGTWPRR